MDLANIWVVPKTVNIHEAKTQLSRLLSRVERGEEIVIARAGRPVARLLPFDAGGAVRVLGGDEDAVWIAPDFDAALPEEVLAEFER
jgi:prevent-host-death family protein